MERLGVHELPAEFNYQSLAYRHERNPAWQPHHRMAHAREVHNREVYELLVREQEAHAREVHDREVHERIAREQQAHARQAHDHRTASQGTEDRGLQGARWPGAEMLGHRVAAVAQAMPLASTIRQEGPMSETASPGAHAPSLSQRTMTGHSSHGTPATEVLHGGALPIRIASGRSPDSFHVGAASQPHSPGFSAETVSGGTPQHHPARSQSTESTHETTSPQTIVSGQSPVGSTTKGTQTSPSRGVVVSQGMVDHMLQILRGANAAPGSSPPA